jgi:hypothetical protein
MKDRLPQSSDKFPQRCNLVGTGDDDRLNCVGTSWELVAAGPAKMSAGHDDQKTTKKQTITMHHDGERR